jgi:hypothetical protein
MRLTCSSKHLHSVDLEKRGALGGWINLILKLAVAVPSGPQVVTQSILLGSECDLLTLQISASGV